MTVFHLLRRPERHTATLQAAHDAIRTVFPVPAKHKADLPYAIRDLSAALTRERSLIRQSYWSSPRLLAAYMHYFLPWNLYRLAWLLPQLPLTLPAGSRILDMGSGPLTLPIALWCSRPDLREKPLTFTCYDIAGQPMELGKRILEALQGSDPLWQVQTERMPLDAALNKHPGQVQAIFAGNVLNELPAPRQGTLEDRLSGIMAGMQKKLSGEGQILLVEPGTRLGGKIIATARQGAVTHGMAPLAPCMHSGPCPMLEQDRYAAGAPAYSGWCHFLFPADGMSGQVAALGKQARLEKETLALSCLLLQNTAASVASLALKSEDDLDDLEALYLDIMDEDSIACAPSPAPETQRRHVQEPVGAPKKNTNLPIRIISDLIRLPQHTEPGRYGCSPSGLVLALDAPALYPGGGFLATPLFDDAGNPLRDKKTTALLVQPQLPVRKENSKPGRNTPQRPKRQTRPPQQRRPKTDQ